MKNMRLLLKVLVFCLIVGQIICPPVKEQKKDEKSEDKDAPVEKDELEDYMEYHRYLREVVNALESDPEFRAKLEKAEEADIRSGKIAHELEYVSHRVRNRLDEIKRAEIERLRHLATKKHELENGIDTEHLKIVPVNKEHLDHANPHTFEIEDLKKLIAKTSQDLAEADRKRREEFKQYEMQKEFEKKEKLKSLDDVQRLEMEKKYKELEEKHKKHEPLHHPGSKQQLEEVWEKQDHMDSQDFDPKTFFMLHDLDSNGYWDPNEVKTLFLKELDKLYQAGAPEDDMRERAEEMERMREHVFREADTNKDGLISFEEFLEQTRKPEFTQDQGWETLDQQRVYTPEEYQEFERRRMEEIERLIAQGMLPPHAAGYPQGVPAHPGQFPPQGQYHPGQQPHYPQGHPNQIPQGHPNAIPQGHPNAIPQGHHNAMPQGHPNAVPQGHPNAVPQGHPNAIPQQGYHPQQGQPIHQGQQFHGQQQQQPQHGQQQQQPQHGQQQFYPGQAPQAQVHPQQLHGGPQQFNQQPQYQHQQVPQQATNQQVPQSANNVNVNSNPSQAAAAPQHSELNNEIPQHPVDTAKVSASNEDQQRHEVNKDTNNVRNAVNQQNNAPPVVKQQ